MKDRECFHMPTSSSSPPLPPPHTHAHTIHTKKGKKGIASIISTIEENKYSEVLFYALHYLSHLNGNYAGLVEPFHANANLLLSLKLTINIVLL